MNVFVCFAVQGHFLLAITCNMNINSITLFFISIPGGEAFPTSYYNLVGISSCTRIGSNHMVIHIYQAR